MGKNGVLEPTVGDMSQVSVRLMFWYLQVAFGNPKNSIFVLIIDFLSYHGFVNSSPGTATSRLHIGTIGYAAQCGLSSYAWP